MRGERGRELVEQAAEQVVGDRRLHRRHRPVRLLGPAGAAQHVVDDGHGHVQRVGQQALAGQRLQRERGDEDGVGQRRQVVVVGELLDPHELEAGAGAEERGEDRRRLTGEGLLRDLQHPDVFTGELRRATEVVGAGLSAPAPAGGVRGGGRTARGGRRCRHASGRGPGPRLGVGGRPAGAATSGAASGRPRERRPRGRRRSGAAAGGVTGDDSSAPAGAGPVSGGWVTLPSSAEGGPTLTGGAGAPPVLGRGVTDGAGRAWGVMKRCRRRTAPLPGYWVTYSL